MTHATTPPPAPSQPEAASASRLGLWWDFFFNKPASTVPTGAIPVQRLTRADLEAAPDDSLWRLGHSTVLMKLQGRFWLTDPVFSERSSPVQWAGPKRFHAPPITIEELPPIEAVAISHDHYDHLDHASILALRDKTAHFIAPPASATCWCNGASTRPGCASSPGGGARRWAASTGLRCPRSTSRAGA